METFLDDESIFNSHIFSIKEDSYKDIAPDLSEENEQINSRDAIQLKTENFKSLSIPPLEPFDLLVTTMNPLDESKFIFKKELIPGFGPVVASGQKVLAHYVMYCENILEPFDSSILRNKPSYLKTGLGDLIEGLEYAILSMKEKETAKFIIKWQYGFLEAGCPPRIPPKANICCFIELIKIIKFIQPVEQSGEFPLSENTFAAKISECEKMLMIAKTLSLDRRFGESIRRMRIALDVLQSLPLKDEEEQKKMEVLLVRVAVNLSVVYNHCNKPELACTHCQIALRINPINQKALFNYGRAKIRLNDFAGAKKVLLTGIKHYPKDEALQEELKRLNTKQADIEARERNLKAVKEIEY